MAKLSLQKGLEIDSEPIVCKLIEYMSFEKISDLELSKEAFKAICAITQLHTNEVHQHLANKILFNNVEFIKAVG